ncbi:Hypothetical protein NTJ_08820 [Nesidiocoris tenuis]|uniref:CTNNB1 binding N-teminal domain-containing protein n=1 Tax=Nesidiocoris tenuis TaxID=355587 RepID=A0ABN7AUY7_9HEMI|nr:Hypothetical protein NTJ_08820 [Nesidiocoris tenuis]
MEGDGDYNGGGGGGGGNDYSNENSTPVRGPGYNDKCRDDLPFEPVSRNNDPFSATEDPEEKYRNERDRIASLKETDIDAIRPCTEDSDDDDGKPGGLAAVIGGSLPNSMADGLSSSQRLNLNGKSPLYTNFGVDEGDGRTREESSCAQDCVYYSVLCCQCSIL